MEEHQGPKKFAEQPQVVQTEPTATTQTNPSNQPSASERSAIVYPSMDFTLLPQVSTSHNSMGERARGEPAVQISPPIQDSVLAICQHIVGLLGLVTEHQHGIMKEMRMIRRDMRLMKGEQHRTNARMVSLVHSIDALTKQFEQQLF